MVGPGLRSGSELNGAARVPAVGYVLATRLPALLVLVLLVIAVDPVAAQSGQLQQLRDDVRSTSPTSSASDDDHHGDSAHHSSHHHGHSHHDDLDALYGKLLFYSVTAPWWAPHAMARDDFSRAAYFPGAPYNNVPGYLEIEPYVYESSKSWGGHFQAEYADDFGDLSRVGGRLLLEHSTRFGIDTQWNYWNEDLGPAGHDQLWTGDANLVFRFAQNKHIAMRSGIGWNWLRDEIGYDSGFNFTYGLDYFPCKPWVFSAEIDWGRLGAQTLFHSRTTAGVVIGHTEVFIGYDYFDVGDTTINGVIAGLGFWF